jgi:hypothetical protein
MRGSENVSSWLSNTENEFGAKEKVTSGGAKQRFQDFEDKRCAPVGNWVSPPTNKRDNQLSMLLTRQILGFDLPNFIGDSKEWPSFITTYNRTTKDCGFSTSENMEELRKCLSGSSTGLREDDITDE